MKIKKLITLLIAFSLALFMIGCESDDDDKVNEFDELLNHIEGSNGGYINNMGGWIKNLSDVNVNDYFLLDIRAEADYNNKRISGAVHSTLANMFDVIDAQNTANKPVFVICYSGQTASYAHVLLNLKGIEAYVMKWGMSIFSQDLDKWTSNCSNQFADHANWSTVASAALPTYDYPSLSTGKEKGEDILDDRIDAAIAKWPVLVTGGEVINNTSAYEIYNYWALADWDKYGHIKDAYQLTPATLKSSGNLKALNPAETNVVYCWTGQTSASVAAYLTVLGYDVKSLKFGVNSMIYDELTGHKWPKPYGG